MSGVRLAAPGDACAARPPARAPDTPARVPPQVEAPRTQAPTQLERFHSPAPHPGFGVRVQNMHPSGMCPGYCRAHAVSLHLLDTRPS